MPVGQAVAREVCARGAALGRDIVTAAGGPQPTPLTSRDTRDGRAGWGSAGLGAEGVYLSDRDEVRPAVAHPQNDV